MLGLIYLIIATYVGFKLLKKLIPFIFNLSSEKTLYGKTIKLQSWIITLPASFLTGTLFMTWLTYLSAYAFQKSDNPLLYGNIVSFSVFILAAVFFTLSEKSVGKDSTGSTRKLDLKSVKSFLSQNTCILIYLLFIVSFISYFMMHSFRVEDGVMKVGWSVYSDFGPHLSMIRSFSLGSNFPTEYPHYADGHIRYHFMFQFLAGNLEFLGLRIDWAFNLPSVLSMVSFLTLLFGLAIILTGKAWVGFLSGILFCFRSSAALLTYLLEERDIKIAFQKILTSSRFIGKTSHEDWGLWTLKDYVNQRHFAFSMGILILIIIAVYPLFRKMIIQLQSFWQTLKEEKAAKLAAGTIDNQDEINTQVQTSDAEDEVAAVEAEAEKPKSAFSRWLDIFLLTRDSWIPQSYIRAVGLGIILGSISFWHGSILISTLLILCFMAVLSKHRLEYLTIAVITVGFTLTQTRFFMGTGSSAVEPQLLFGFLARNKTLLGVSQYYLELCGILPIIIIASLLLLPKGGRWLTLSFFIPLVFATTMTLVPDVAINHKYVAVSVILLNIFAANFVHSTLTSKGIVSKVAASLLILALTATGIANTFALYNMDKNYAPMDMSNPVREWIMDSTKTSDIFLTDDAVINQVLLAGRRIFNGYGYFAGSAGYDVDARNRLMKEIYGGSDPNAVRKLAKENNIKYIVVDNSNRGENWYKLNEEFIRSNFTLVKHFDWDNTDIYIVD